MRARFGARGGVAFRPVVVGAIWLLVPGIAHAYIDAGTGGMMIQMAIAAFAAVGTAVSMFWGRIKAAVGKKPAAPITGEDEPSPAVHAAD